MTTIDEKIRQSTLRIEKLKAEYEARQILIDKFKN